MTAANQFLVEWFHESPPALACGEQVPGATPFQIYPAEK
jgi:hypothetical protein